VVYQLFWALLILLIIAADQAAKYLVSANIEYGSRIRVIENFFYITFHRNKGAAWGILQNARYFLILLTIIITIVLTVYLVKASNRLLKTSLSFIIAGAVSNNLIDRVIHGGVTDFLQFFIGSYEYPNFNVADMFIVIGAILLAYYLIFVYKEEDVKTKSREGA